MKRIAYMMMVVVAAMAIAGCHCSEKKAKCCGTCDGAKEAVKKACCGTCGGDKKAAVKCTPECKDGKCSAACKAKKAAAAPAKPKDHPAH